MIVKQKQNGCQNPGHRIIEERYGERREEGNHSENPYHTEQADTAGCDEHRNDDIAHAAPGGRVLVCTALSGGDMEERLTRCCRAFGADRIVLDLQRLRMDFPLPCPGGEGVYLTGEQLAQRQRGRAVFYSRTLGARYFTYRSGSGTRFVLFDDGDTLRRKIALGRQLGITRGLLTLPECGDILDEVIRKEP